MWVRIFYRNADGVPLWWAGGPGGGGHFTPDRYWTVAIVPPQPEPGQHAEGGGGVKPTVSIWHRGDTAVVDLWYPRVEGQQTHVEVGLVDVRAADSIRISYDFDRDGWVIEQAAAFEWDGEDDCDPQWGEVAFVQAWAREGRAGD